MDYSEPLLILPLDCETTIALLDQCLRAEGLRVVRSFDLRSACASFPENVCPHHGTSPCDCQMVVLLVYGEEEHPATLVVRGHVSRTEVELVNTPESITRLELENRVGQALEPKKIFPFNNFTESWNDAA